MSRDFTNEVLDMNINIPPTLLLMCGIPRSGKSTRANEISKRFGAPIVCPDDFRLEMYGHEFFAKGERHVWASVHAAARALSRRHKLVIIDATNTTIKRRKEWLHGPWHRVAYEVVVEKIGICVERAGDNMGLIGAIERMADQWEHPTRQEVIFAWELIEDEFARQGEWKKATRKKFDLLGRPIKS